MSNSIGMTTYINEVTYKGEETFSGEENMKKKVVCRLPKTWVFPESERAVCNVPTMRKWI